MNAIIRLMKRYPLAAFLILTFGISWSGGLLGITLLYPFGPSVAALILVLLTCDREGRRDFLRRVIDVKRISASGYLFIVLIVPALMTGAVILDVLFGGPPAGMNQLKQIIAQPQILLEIVVSAFIIGALSEEIGWRGFGLDSALKRWSTLQSSLVIGIFWFVWHLPLFAIPGTLQYQWGWFTPLFWVYLLTVVLLSILFTWVSLQNRASILSAVLLHFFYNFTLGLILPVSDRVLFIVMALLSVVVALIVRFNPVSTALQHRPAPQSQMISNDLSAEEGA